MKTISKNAKIIVGTLAIIALVIPFSLLDSIEIVQAENDPNISAVTVIDGYSDQAGATTNYTVKFTVPSGSSISTNTEVSIRFEGRDCPWDVDWTQCRFDLGNATATPSGFAIDNQWEQGQEGIAFIPASTLTAGQYTIVFTGVINPATIGGMYTVKVATHIQGDPQPEGDTPSTLSAPLLLGNIIMSGTVYASNGTTPVPNVWVQLHTPDWSFDSGSNTNDNGQYAIIGQAGSGQYTAELHLPGDQTGFVAPDPININYTGSTITKNFSMIPATKTLKVKVVNNVGDPVSTANIWANKPQGGGGVGADVDSTGLAQFNVSGGQWEVFINCGWDHENQKQKDCQWSYNEPSQSVNFAEDSSTETKTINITVQKTNAKIKGTVYMPNGTTKMAGGHIDIKSGDQGGMGTGVERQGPNQGKFEVNVQAGRYEVMFWPDTWEDSSLAKYYADPIKLEVGEDQTKTLKIILKEKTAKIKGKVKDEDGVGVEGVWVNSWMQNGQDWANAQSGTGGAYEMWVTPGTWGVNVDTGRREPDQTTFYISADDRPIDVDVAKDQTVSGVNLTVQLADASVEVQVVDTNNNAITDIHAGAFCRIEKMGMHGPGMEFHGQLERGTANIPLLGGQEYQCGMWLPPEVPLLLEKEKTVTVAAGQQNKVIKLTLVAPDSTIKGWVKDQNGNLVKNMSHNAEVFAVKAGDWQWTPGQLNDDGSFNIGVMGGTNANYMVGVNFWNRENSEYMESHPEPDDVITVPANSEVTEIITVFKVDTYISGKVYDPDGNPMPHVWVNADNWPALEGKIQGEGAGKPVNAGTETRGDGSYRLGVVSSTYNVHSGLPPEFDATFMSPKEVEVTVTAKKPGTVNLHYRQADAFVKATALYADGTSPEFGWCYGWSEDGGHNGREYFGGEATIPFMAGTGWFNCDTWDPETNKFYRGEEQQITLKTGDTKSASFTLQEETFMVPESFTETFTATNLNNFQLPDGTTVLVPANSIGTDDSTYTLMAEPATSMMFTSDDKPLAYGWDLEVTKQSDEGTELVETFNSNVTICMPVPIDYIEENDLTVDDIFPKYWNSTAGTWSNPDSAIINEAEGTACWQTDHFTQFALTTVSAFGAAAGISGPADVMATPASQGGPQIIIADENGNVVTNFFAYDSNLRIGLTASTADVDADGDTEIVVAPGAGAGPQVRVFDHEGNVENQFFAYPEHIRTGIYVTTGDVNGDGTPDIITSTREGSGPQVRVFDAEGNVISQFMAYADTYRNGFRVTTGDVNGNGSSEIIVVPDGNAGPQIRVFDYQGNELVSFFAYTETVRGGYNATTGDVNGDGVADIIISPKAGLGPQVAMFTGTGTLINRFFAYAETFRGGINVSVGDTDGDGNNDIVACPESGAGPQIRVFDTDGSAKSQFWAYASTLRGKFTSFVADLNGDGTTEIVTAPGEGMGPQVRTFDKNGNPLSQYFTHHTGFRGGLNMFPAY